MIVHDKASVLTEIAAALDAGNSKEATAIGKREYPWYGTEVPKRKMTQKKSLNIFVRDGFIDRYSGSKLLFPGALLLLSQALPDAFPAHQTWKVAETHDIYFDLWPVVDHIIPLARGGLDEESNFVTTSNINNDIKSHWTLEQLGWELHPGGKIDDWDGMMGWFLRYTGRHPEFLEHRTLKGWHNSAISLF